MAVRPNMEQLIQKGEERGFLTQGEILGLFPDMELGDKQVAAFYDLLLERGILITETLNDKDTKDIIEIEADFAQFDSDDPDKDQELVNTAMIQDPVYSLHSVVMDQCMLPSMAVRQRRLWCHFLRRCIRLSE